MKKFKQNKLWRDKAVAMLEQHGSRIHWQRLNDQEYDFQLRLKLLEEAEEVQAAQDKKEIMSELADVLEVINAFCELYAIPFKDVKAIQEKKRQERGGFSERMYVTVAEHAAGSMGEKYCRAAPHKYPEIIEG